jgi:hypothetical protein
MLACVFNPIERFGSFEFGRTACAANAIKPAKKVRPQRQNNPGQTTKKIKQPGSHPAVLGDFLLLMFEKSHHQSIGHIDFFGHFLRSIPAGIIFGKSIRMPLFDKAFVGNFCLPDRGIVIDSKGSEMAMNIHTLRIFTGSDEFIFRLNAATLLHGKYQYAAPGVF